MAELDYDALQRLADAATPGVWARSGSRSIESDMGDGSWQIVVDQMNDGVGAGVIEAADADFVAAARTAIPALLDRVRELEAERDAALSTIAKVEAIHQKTYVNRHFRGYACSTCVDPYEDRAMKWPCPTIRALGSVPSTNEEELK